MSKPADYNTLLERVRARVVKSASASDQGIAVPSEEDPNLKGNATPPGDEALDGKKEKQTTPESKDNKDNGEAGKTLENSEAETHGSGEGDKGPAAQHPEELPTGDDLYSKQASEIVALLKEKIGIKQASAKKPEPTKEAAAEVAPKKEETKKTAGKADEVELPEQFTTEFHVKLASQLLATEEGREHARSILADSIGAEAVDTLIKQAAAMEEAYVKQAAAMEQEFRKQAAFEAHVKEAMAKMDPTEREEFIKSAKFHQSEVAKLEYDFEKQAYPQGAMDAAAMEQAGGELPEIPGEGSDMTMDEVVMILQQMVESGEIDPALADAILQAVMAEMGGGAMPAEAAAAPTPDAAVAEEMPKAASVDDLVDSIIGEQKED